MLIGIFDFGFWVYSSLVLFKGVFLFVVVKNERRFRVVLFDKVVGVGI